MVGVAPVRGVLWFVVCVLCVCVVYGFGGLYGLGFGWNPCAVFTTAANSTTFRIDDAAKRWLVRDVWRDVIDIELNEIFGYFVQPKKPKVTKSFLCQTLGEN